MPTPIQPSAVSPKNGSSQSRRTFLKAAGAGIAGMAGLVSALKPLLELESGQITLSEMLQKHYKELYSWKVSAYK